LQLEAMSDAEREERVKAVMSDLKAAVRNRFTLLEACLRLPIDMRH
jgi:hypothetical protein